MGRSSDAPRYEKKTVRTVRGLEPRTRAKWESQGWEFVGQDIGRVQTTLTFRRLAPKFRRVLWTVGGVAVAALLAVVITVGVVNERNAPPSANPVRSDSSEAEVSMAPVDPTPIEVDETARPAVLPANDDEVLVAFRDFVSERAAAGVLLAQAVTDVSFSGRVVTVTVDPGSVGYTETQFRELVPFENLAEIFVTPMAFNDAVGPRLRAAVDAVATVDASGASRGSRTTQWVIGANELD